MARLDIIPPELRSPRGPTDAQWRAIVRAVLLNNNSIIGLTSSVTMGRIEKMGWITEDGRVTRKGLAAVLSLPKPCARSSYTNISKHRRATTSA